MSLKKWKSEFSKKDFVNVLRNVVKENLREFDYTKTPYVLERKLPEDALMGFYGDGKFTMIAYDYAKFKRRVGDLDDDYQYLYAVQCIAHEMRHYYQHRQMTAKMPIEKDKTLNDWKQNKIIKTRGMEKVDNYEYWFSARELDANLYAYVFTLRNCKRASLNPIQGKSYFKALKKLYKEYGGRRISKYFPRKLKKMV